MNTRIRQRIAYLVEHGGLYPKDEIAALRYAVIALAALQAAEVLVHAIR